MTMTTTRLDYAAARKAMLDSQLRTSGVNDAFVLERMGAVPREDFVPKPPRQPRLGSMTTTARRSICHQERRSNWTKKRACVPP